MTPTLLVVLALTIPTAEAGAHLGVRGWKTAYRNTDAVFAYGVNGGWIPLRWLEVAATLDHSQRTFKPADLAVTNTETWLLTGPRFGIWVNHGRFFAEALGGGALRTASYHGDVSGTARVTPGFGVGVGFTILLGRIGVGMRGDWRRRSDQSNLLVTLDVSWFFGRREPKAE